MYEETFGQKLKQAREDAGYTQKDIELILGIKSNTLSQYETGERQPKIEIIGKLADFYEISTDWLIGTKGNNK